MEAEHHHVEEEPPEMQLQRPEAVDGTSSSSSSDSQEEVHQNEDVKLHRSVSGNNLREDEENVRMDVVEDSDEEVLQLKLERAAEKIQTHTPYCRYCNNQIIKVILRRKKRSRPRAERSLDRLGCLTCFSIFIPSGDCLNPFNLSRRKQKLESHTSAETIHRGVDIDLDCARQPLTCGIARSRSFDSLKWIVGRSRSFEILKWIVYGALISSIAILSVVSSATASDATTSKVITIGLAILVGILIVFLYSLLDLKITVKSPDIYQELLSTMGHFIFLLTFAILAYLIVGLVAPRTHELTLSESDNKDYKIIAVAAAGLACVFTLAIARAYFRRTTRFSGYVKTILSYVTMAVATAGVAYAAGDLIGMVLDKHCCFEPAREVNSLVSEWASSY